MELRIHSEWNLKAMPRVEKITSAVNYQDGSTELSLPETQGLQLAQKMRKRMVPKTGLLPPAVRYISRDYRIVIFERPPMIQTITYSEAPRDASEANKVPKHTFSLPIPWTVYVVAFGDNFVPESVRVYVRCAPIQSLQDELYMLPMLNLYVDGKLCPPVIASFTGVPGSLAAGIHAAYNLVWSSNFNFDLRDAFTFCVGDGRPSFLQNVGSDNLRMFRRAFRKWSQRTMGSILSDQWAVHPPHSLDEALGIVGEELDAEVPNNAHTLCVHIINTIYSTQSSKV